MQLHYCRQLRALLIRVHWKRHTFGLDVYRWFTGLSVFHWNGDGTLTERDYGKVGG
jgi:hypothetical protein